MTVPLEYRLVRSVGNESISSLYEVVLKTDSEYALGSVYIANISGSSRFEIGKNYAQLLGNETVSTFEAFLSHTFPNKYLRILFETFADWLWNEYASKHVPVEFMEEMDGMKSVTTRGYSVDVVSRRFNTLANLPADPQNIITMLEEELERNISPEVRKLLNEIINALDKCSWCDNIGSDRNGGSTRLRIPLAPGCDSFAVWGSRTASTNLFSSRNLDWNSDTGIAMHKLITVLHPPNANAYATFGFASGIGALAGMSRAGMTVSEMNLDNAETTFDGPPFPLRLRMVLENASSLAEARALWDATNNTDSMNFLIASGHERSAFEIEAVRGFSAFFEANDPIEASATCIAESSKRTEGGGCGDVFPNATTADVRIGSPMPEVVFRSNHAFHPTVMMHQEPLFNDTVFRYKLLAHLFEELNGTEISDVEAVNIAGILAIKGPNFFSCNPDQFQSGGSNIMSIVYAPHEDNPHAWVAWEDGSGISDWRPAACNPYVRIDFGDFWL